MHDPAPLPVGLDERTFIRVGVRPDTQAACQAVADPTTGEMLTRINEGDWPRALVRMRIVESCIVGRGADQVDLLGCDALLTLWIPQGDGPDQEWKYEKLRTWAAAFTGNHAAEYAEYGTDQLLAIIQRAADMKCHLVSIQTDARGLLQVSKGIAFDDELRATDVQLDPRLSCPDQSVTFQQLIARYGARLNPTHTQELIANRQLITNTRQLQDAVSDLTLAIHMFSQVEVGLDLETDFGPLGPPSNWDARNGSIRLMQVAFGPSSVYVIDCRQVNPLPLLKLLFDRKVQVIIHYSGFEQSWLSWAFGIDELPNVQDTRADWMLIQQHLSRIDPLYQPASNSLEDVAMLALGVQMDKDWGHEVWWGADQLDERELRYAALDAAILPVLGQVTRELLHVLGCASQSAQMTRRILERAARIRGEADDPHLESDAAKLVQAAEDDDDVTAVAQMLTSVPLSWRQRRRLKQAMLQRRASWTEQHEPQPFKLDFAKLGQPETEPDSPPFSQLVARMQLRLEAHTKDTNTLGQVRVVNRHHGEVGDYIGRGTPLGNPFKRPDDGTTKDEVIGKYRTWLWQQLSHDSPQRRALDELAVRVQNGENVNLVCSCAPRACHGDVVKRAIEWRLQQLEGKSTSDT